MRIIWSEIAQATFVRFMADQAGMMAVNRAVEALADDPAPLGAFVRGAYRSRFQSGDLPPGGRLMVRYDAADAGELRWARVESWEDAGHAVIRDTGRELAPGVRPGPLVAIETRLIADWGIWVDGSGVVEGAGTESADHHLS